MINEIVKKPRRKKEEIKAEIMSYLRGKENVNKSALIHNLHVQSYHLDILLHELVEEKKITISKTESDKRVQAFIVNRVKK